MAKKDSLINQPGPAQTQQRDLEPLKALIRKHGPPTFRGARRGYGMGAEDWRVVNDAAQEYQAHKDDDIFKLVLTLAHTAYWEMFDEQS